MNETLQVEQAYFNALGIETVWVNDVVAECEYLVSKSTKDRMWSVVWGSKQAHGLMLGHEIRVEWYYNEVWATYFSTPKYFRVKYGDAQWKTREWAFGMAVVQAVTEKINIRP